MYSTIKATGRFMRSRSRLQLLKTFANHWRFWNSPVISVSYLIKLFPESAGNAVSVTADISNEWELPYGERLVLASILKVIKPKTAFEFGTFSGSTTTLIADSMPQGGIVHTLELPDDQLSEAAAREIGSNFRSSSKYANNIVQHRADSRNFDFSTFAGHIDFVYIDGSHKFTDVLSDSKNALKMLSPEGIIVWDDYQPSCASVVEAINTLAKEISLIRIAQTRLVIFGVYLL